MNVLVFDLETVPDVRQARTAGAFQGVDDREVADWMFARRGQQTRGASEVLRPHQQRIIAVGTLLQHQDRFKLWCLGDSAEGEAGLVRAFFRLVEHYRPVLVSWNGRGFDLPVLHYRALLHGVPAPAYWGGGGRAAYGNRYGMRHIDLMDVLANYDGRAVAPLQEIALLLGLPGKPGMEGADVWEQYLAGNLSGVRAYCEIDVLNTYLVYLRFELLRGVLAEEDYQRRLVTLRTGLAADEREHLRDFLRRWEQRSGEAPGAAVAPPKSSGSQSEPDAPVAGRQGASTEGPETLS